MTDEFKLVKEKVRISGFTDTMGLLFRAKRAELPAVSSFDQLSAKRQKTISDVQLRLVLLEEARELTPALDDLLNEMRLASGAISLSVSQTEYARKSLERLLADKRRLHEQLQKDYNA